MSGDSATKDISTQATAASTAFPPRAQGIDPGLGGERVAGGHHALHRWFSSARIPEPFKRTRATALIVSTVSGGE